MVLEMRSWTCCLSGMQGVGKHVDFIKERVEIHAQEFLMLRDSSAPRLRDVFKGFFFMSPWGLFGNVPIFPHPSTGLFAEFSSWNMSPLPVLQVGLFTAMCKHTAHTVQHKLKSGTSTAVTLKAA